MTKKTMGLLVMAYGTPYSEQDIERYYTHIRHGRTPSPESLQDLTDRYTAIGGISPLAKITLEQARGLERTLNEMQDDITFKMYLGLKHIEPFVEDAVLQMKQDGIEEAVSIVLAPHYSTFSVKSYNGRAEEASKQCDGPKIHSITDWYEHPQFIRYWSQEVQTIFNELTEEQREKACLIVSAHSLPERIIAAGDPYPQQLQRTADLLASEANVKHYFVGWQSAGNTPDPWIGPDVQDLTEELYGKYEFTTFVYAPVGFVADHLEVLYDNDIECKVVTDRLGVNYRRPAMPNAKQEFLNCLADVVTSHLKSTKNSFVR